jgi:putative cardiolipin synthase
VQYFIWSIDKIGILAAEALLTAAERGVNVRVIVDDLLVDADNADLIALNAHPNVHIKIYNPKHSVGVLHTERAINVVTNFRGANQRMHDKTMIVDGIAGITGGRNMAEEYFDYDEEYNFRDRDMLVLGAAVTQMEENFEEFWQNELSVGIQAALDGSGSIAERLDTNQHYHVLHEYANNPDNFEPEVRDTLAAMSEVMPTVFGELVWDQAIFISDAPGKNSNRFFLDGGGEATSALFDVVAKAEKSVLIQSPYLVLPEGGIELFEELTEKGVRIKISTNSLASTDNLLAFSGYKKQRKAILKTGVEVYEYNPNPAIQQQLIERYPRLADNSPVFAIHAKSMVVDEKVLYIGTFNLDPRSANLNTEVGIIVENEELANQLTQSIENDMHAENSWQTTLDYNPDSEAPFFKRTKVFFLRMLPLDPVL